MKLEIAEALERAQKMAYNTDYHIHAGVDRKAVAKDWKGKRTYISILCFSLAGNYKGKYDCGYIDAETKEYVVTKYTEIDLEKNEWVGR